MKKDTKPVRTRTRAAMKASHRQRKLKLKESGLEPRHEIFCQRVSEGMELKKAYVAAGFAEKGARQNASRLMANDYIAARISELIQAAFRRRAHVMETLMVRTETGRLDMLQRMQDAVLDAINRRSRGESALPTGLIVATTHSVGSGDNQFFEKRETYDPGPVRDLIDIGKTAAQHIGEWSEKIEVNWDGDPSKLSDEQLENLVGYFERQYIVAGQPTTALPEPEPPQQKP